MEPNDSRLMMIVAGCLASFLAGVVGLAFISDEVKDRVDRRVKARVCALVADACPPAPAPTFDGGAGGD